VALRQIERLTQQTALAGSIRRDSIDRAAFDANIDIILHMHLRRAPASNHLHDHYNVKITNACVSKCTSRVNAKSINRRYRRFISPRSSSLPRVRFNAIQFNRIDRLSRTAPRAKSNAIYIPDPFVHGDARHDIRAGLRFFGHESRSRTSRFGKMPKL